MASLHLALQKLGAVSVPLSTRFGPDELGYCVEDCAPRLVVTDAEHAQRAGSALAGRDLPWAHLGEPDDAPDGAAALAPLAERAGPLTSPRPRRTPRV
jgi:2-furoate---CoA ligase